MKIAIASDHGGFELKEIVKRHLESSGHDIFDAGTDSAKSCDYPDFISVAAERVAQDRAERAVVICTTGIGATITANKINGVRAALCHNLDGVEFSRRHNDANVLALGAKYVKGNEALKMVDLWLATEFEGGRHAKRVDKIMKLEEKS